MERKLNEFLSAASLHLVLQQHPDAVRQGRSDQAFQSLLGAHQQVQKRLDGKPVLMERFARFLSASHHSHLTLAITSPRPVGCDIEAIFPRAPQLWQYLLGPERWQLATFL